MQHNGNLLSSEDIPAILREHLEHTNPGPTSTAARSTGDPPTNTTATATSSAPTTNNFATPTSSAPPAISMANSSTTDMPFSTQLEQPSISYATSISPSPPTRPLFRTSDSSHHPLINRLSYSSHHLLINRLSDSSHQPLINRLSDSSHQPLIINRLSDSSHHPLINRLSDSSHHPLINRLSDSSHHPLINRLSDSSHHPLPLLHERRFSQAHRNPALLHKLKENHILPVYVPASCTGELQPLDADGGINDLLKRDLKTSFVKFYADSFARERKASPGRGISKEGRKVPNVKVDLKLTTLKPPHANWLLGASIKWETTRRPSRGAGSDQHPGGDREGTPKAGAYELMRKLMVLHFLPAEHILRAFEALDRSTDSLHGAGVVGQQRVERGGMLKCDDVRSTVLAWVRALNPGSSQPKLGDPATRPVYWPEDYLDLIRQVHRSSPDFVSVVLRNHAHRYDSERQSLHYLNPSSCSGGGYLQAAETAMGGGD
ncbi:hypothetical protein Bbelb_319040 [Branchiostoma belcheri]|nr:hypothetical protein Bbelb_319040 [Branchiostoma belcheri]